MFIGYTSRNTPLTVIMVLSKCIAFVMLSYKLPITKTVEPNEFNGSKNMF
jgi:hypothetical protein